MAEYSTEATGYNKRPLWQWVLIYLVIGVVIYGIIYYFVFAKKGGSNYSQPQQSMNTKQQTTTPTNTAPTNTVQISNFSFSPTTLTVKMGSTVTWQNQDSVGHSATADNNSFDTGVISPGLSGTATFTKPGNYDYHCSVHPSMHATIVVQ